MFSKLVFVFLFSSVPLLVGAIENVHGFGVYEKMFVDWMKHHNIQFFDPKEFSRRLQIFSDNHEKIIAHNKEHGASFLLAHNEFSHLTLKEFQDHFRIGSTRPGHLRKNHLGSKGPIHEAPEDLSTIPKEWDWVEKGAVTPVKNQGQCGSCWSFSAVGALEGAYFVKYGDLVSFSEQELVSCDTTDNGCNGGLMDDAFAWVEKNGGLCTESDYAYTSGAGGSSGSCEEASCKNVAGVTPKSYRDVKVDSVPSLMSAVAKQPVAIAIEADQFVFQFYKSGVLTANCGENLDHGVLLVGYGTWTDGTDYWKVKNSWGPGWGMEGFILIKRGTDDL